MTSNYIGEDGGWLPDSVPYKVRAGVLLTILGLHIIYAIIILMLFIIKARDRHSGLAQRSVALVTFQTVALFCVGSAGLISTSIPRWPCFLRLWLINIGDALLFASIAARAIQHIVVSNVHTLTNKIASNNYSGFKGVAQHNINSAYMTQTTRPMRSASQSSMFSNTGFDSETNHLHVSGALGRSNTGRSEKKRTMELTNPMQGSDMHMQSESDLKLYRKLKRYTRWQRYVSDKALSLFLVGHILAMGTLSLITNIVDDQFSLKPLSVRCTIMWGFLPVVGVDGFYVVFILPILLVKCWSLKDAFGIRNDLLISIIIGTICLILTIVWETALYQVAEQWSGWFFSWVCAIVLHTTSLAIPLWSAMRHSRDVLHRMHGADALAPVGMDGTSMAAVIANAAGGTDMGRRAEFNSILADPYEYRFFCDFAASCFCSEMTAFIDEYQSLKSLTVIALGSEDIWREDADQLDPGYMSRMASNIDSGISYLALANRDHPNAKALRLQTPPTVCILETARAVYPQYDLSEVTPFPVASMDKLVAMFSVFINSNSYTAVSLPSAMVLRIRERLGRSQLTLTIFDEIKDEVLNMLYFDVFTRYAKRK
ncbi:hypothetical protein IW140_006429 [Coemansia sp. RSA 1813]|nr:hypothetical protein EV178_006404 [Coemansia sp. RSA 1646]KAJ1765108.1 hypothetical protein LPJ74_006478 [Coemansia sp. RSA 1843]KAJ2085319.1 hypothetical protein IW138_006398 [Coemansia sp. RSA 986]KAJ2212986.1 hypothetical protein EV179_004214 [Coemansia sp. RSA 487]KAJ2562409.1 hypothetical protein IW140_006429 [Coemansia sp. RSA 1813]